MRQENNQPEPRFLSAQFLGVIKSGKFKYDQTLTLSYALSTGEIWDHIDGQISGISQKSSASEDKIVWNMPFSAKYQTKEVAGWPQLVIVLYGTDYFGRSIVRGYGNVHLPTRDGIHERKVRMFKPVDSFSIWSCLNCCAATYPEYKEAEKVLTMGKDRQHTKVQYLGEIEIEVEVKKQNFNKFGYE